MIILPNGLTPQEIRVLQEFRRLNADTLTVEQINAIRHPAGGGEGPAASLVAKGLLSADGGSYTVTAEARDFLAIEAKPAVEETSDAGASAAANPGADGV